MKWTAKRAEPLGEAELAEYSEFGLSEKFARLLHIRGIDSSEKVKNFLDFSIEKLHDPFKLSGMQDAVTRIHSAIVKKERILIIGDYDCDGICATAILYKYLLTRYARTKYFLPNRDADGYGLSIELIDKLKDKFDPQLIITVDCGISCPDEIAHAKSLGIDCIVTDHHAIPEIVPDCVIVNPKLPSQEYPFDELCGAGVSLKLVQALETYKLNCKKAGLDEAVKYFDIAALATVADIVPLVDENRIIVHHGLARMNANSNPAISALSRSCNVYGPIKSQDIGFKLGPKINAAGRMGVAKRGLDLLLERDPKRIDEIIRSLGDLNSSRQKITHAIADEAEELILKGGLDKENILIVYKDTWEGGVLGIVAARITDKFHKPAIVLSKNGDIWKGSARSVRGINMVELMGKFSHLLVSHGGHMMAAGLSIQDDNLQEFSRSVKQHLGELKIIGTEESHYEFDLQANEISSQFISELEMLEPTGCQNTVPTFKVSVNSCHVSPLPNHPRHIRFSTKLDFGYLNFIMFDAARHGELLALEFPKDVLFEFQKNLDVATSVKAIAKGIVPRPSDERSLAMSLRFALTTGDWHIDERLGQIKSNLVVDRNEFVEYYRGLQKFSGSRVNGVYNLFTRVRATKKDVCPYQFIFVCAVLEELGILILQDGVVLINSREATELNNSEIYLKVKGEQ